MKILKKLVRKRELSSQSTSIGARLALSFMSSIGNKSAYPLSYLVPRFSLTPILLSRLERCQRWFLRIIFHVPKFASSVFIERLAGVNSVESEIDYHKLLLIGRLPSVPNLPVTVGTLFRTRIESFYDEKISAIGVISTLFEALCKPSLQIYLEEWCRTANFPTYSVWKNLVKERIILYEKNRWSDHCLNHPNMEISRLFLENMPPDTFWSISNKFPDLVRHLHQQVRLTANYGLNGGVPWLCRTNSALCFFCKNEVEDCSHFFHFFVKPLRLISVPSGKILIQKFYS